MLGYAGRAHVSCEETKVVEQKMAYLLKERVLPDAAPFTNVGVDYFGPIRVKRGQSLLKKMASNATLPSQQPLTKVMFGRISFVPPGIL